MRERTNVVLTCRSSCAQSSCVECSSALVLMNWNNFKKTQGSEENKAKISSSSFKDACGISKSVTVLAAELLGEFWVVTKRHQDVHTLRYHPRPTVCGKA